MRPLHFLLLLLLSAVAVTIADEEVEIEGLETLVALNAPKSEENDGESKKARLTFLDDLEAMEPQLRYVAPKSTTTVAPTTTATVTTSESTTVISKTVVATTEAADTESTATTAVAASTTTETATTAAPTSTTAAATTSETEKKMEKLDMQTQKPVVIPIPLPDKEILNAIVETSEPILIQLPYLPKLAGVLTAGQSMQGNPWGTEAIQYQTRSVNELTIPPVAIGSELDIGETSSFLPAHSLISNLPENIQILDEKKEGGKMSAEEMERAHILITTLRAMKSEVEETLRQINEGEKITGFMVDESTPPPTTTTTVLLSTTSAPSTQSATKTTTNTTPAPSTTSSPTATTPIPTTATNDRPSTRPPITGDEVKSTLAVQATPDVVDNSASRFASSRIEGYTKTVSKIVDNDRTQATSAYKRIPHDNSFLPNEDAQFRPSKILPKKRHLIENGDEVKLKKLKRRLKKKVKKLVTSSPTTIPSPPPSSPHSTTTFASLPSNLPPILSSPTSTAPRKFIVQRAVASQAPQQFQVSPAVQPIQLQQPAFARAAPIYRPDKDLYQTLAPEPQYYVPPPPIPAPSIAAPQPGLGQIFAPFFDNRQSQLSVPQQPQLPIVRYEPVVYYRPVYGRKKREIRKGHHFKRQENQVILNKAEKCRFSRLHAVMSPSFPTQNKHNRVFNKRSEEVVVKKVENEEMKKTIGLAFLPKSPQIRKSPFEGRTQRVKRGTERREVNTEFDEIEKAFNGQRRGPTQMGEREERHTGVDELASELEMIEKMKRKRKEANEEPELMEDEEDFDDDEEEEKETPNYKKFPPTIEELKSLEDSLQVDHEQMKKHPQGELRLNEGERPKLFSHGRTFYELRREEDYESDAAIADSFHLPASDSELHELHQQRLRASEVAPVSPTASPLRRRRHRIRQSTRDEEEVETSTRIRAKKRRTTDAPTTRSPLRSRRPATIIPNFHPKEVSPDSDSLASLPFDEVEATRLRARGLRRNRHTPDPPTTTTTTTEIPETTTRRGGRPPRVLPKKESSFSLPAGGNRFFYDRDCASQVVTRSPPHAPPTLTPTPLAPPTLIPQQDTPTISPDLSIDELAVLPREALLQELKRLSEQLSDRLEETEETGGTGIVSDATTTTALPPPPPRDEEIVDEEDRELIEAIRKGEKNGKDNDPFEFIGQRKEITTTTVVPDIRKDGRDRFRFALPSKKMGEVLTIDDLVLSDDVNEASIGQDIDAILADVGVGDNSIGTRKRAIEAIMELKKKKAGDSKAKKCQPTSCSEKEEIPKDDLELVTQLRAVNMKHPLARDRKFSLFATNKKSYYILPDGRVLVVNEQSKLARTNSGEELHLEEESTEDSVPEYSSDVSPSTTTTAFPTTVVPRSTTAEVLTTKRKRTRASTTTTTPFPIEGSDYEDPQVESATISLRPKIGALAPGLPTMKKVVIPWRTTTSIPISTTTTKILIHDGGIEPTQVSVFATPRSPPKSSIVVHKDEESKHFPATTLENELDETQMMREELLKYLEEIDLAKTFGGKKLEDEAPSDEKFDRAVTKTEEEYTDDTEYEDTVTEEQRQSPSASSSQVNPKSVDDIDLRKWFTIGKDNAAVRRAKKGDGIAENILDAASEVPDEEVADDEFLAEESVNLFPEDFVRVLRSVAGGERVPMKMLRRLGLRLRAARLRRH